MNIRIDNVSDYIAPSQACVNPIFAPAPAPIPAARPAIVIGIEGAAEAKEAPKKAQISLSDCLACSGCVTSAETVLLQLQSAQKFVEDCRRVSLQSSQHRVIVVTLSPQSRASLAVRFNLEPVEVHRRLSMLLKTHFGVNYVLNSATLAHEVALTQVAHEFVARYRANQAALPLITSACPGWVCYAEKSQPSVIPFLSTAKSAQQVEGVLVKHVLASKLGISPSEIYHACIMPCPDKKLESAREDFATNGARDVDLVLTTTEVCDALLSTMDQNLVLDDVFALSQPDNDPSNSVEPLNDLLFSSEEPQAGGSGGYLAYCFRFAARELFNVDVPPGPLPFRAGRNSDTWSIELHVDGKAVLRFEAAYGFRNVQSIVRKVKNGACTAHFVEMMACPAGCANGGGQLPGADVKLVRSALDAVTFRSPGEQNSSLADFYLKVIGGPPSSSRAVALLHTHFKAVEKMMDPDSPAQAPEW